MRKKVSFKLRREADQQFKILHFMSKRLARIYWEDKHTLDYKRGWSSWQFFKNDTDGFMSRYLKRKFKRRNKNETS